MELNLYNKTLKVQPEWMPSKKRNTTKQLQRSALKKESKPQDKKFVSKFLAVMQRFPETEMDELSKEEENTVNTFFVRLINYTNGTKITYKPDFLVIAFIVVSFADRIFFCKCNPFKQILMHRALDFVGAVFQVIIDCNESEDDGRDDFLPTRTAENFALKLKLYNEVFKFHYEFEKSGCCRCSKLKRLQV